MIVCFGVKRQLKLQFAKGALVRNVAECRNVLLFLKQFEKSFVMDEPMKSKYFIKLSFSKCRTNTVN